MRFDSIRLRGLGPFRGDVSVDLSALPGTLVAVCGENGAGKTTILELLTAALYRDTPTRGSLASLATSRDAFVEVKAVNGAPYTFRQSVDAVSLKGEALVLDASGNAVLPDTKVAAFDKWAATHLPPAEVLFASTFQAQGSGGFLDLKAGERKSLLLKVLGIERIEKLAELAREEVRTAKATASTVAVQLGDERSRSGTPSVIAAELDAARVALAEAEAAHEAAKADLRQADEEDRARKRQADEHRAALQRATELSMRLTDAKGRVADLERRIANNRDALSQESEIRAAAARVAVIAAEDARLGEELSKVDVERAGAQSRLDLAEAKERELDRALTLARTRVERAESAAQHIAAWPDLALVVREKERAEEDAQERLRELEALEPIREKEMQTGWQTRVGCLREALSDIVEDDSAAASGAAEALSADDVLAEKQIAAPAALLALRNGIRTARAALETATRELAVAEKQSADLEMLRPLAADLDAARAEVAAIEQDAERAQADAAEEASKGARLAGERSVIVDRRRAFEEERIKLAPLAAKLAPLESATARLSELEPEAATARIAVVELTAQLAAAVPPEAVVTCPSNLDALRAAVDVHAQAIKSHAGAVAVKEAQHAASLASVERLEALELDLRRAEAAVADWTLLADSLGKDGLQALEIDAAGPEMTATINDLLHASFGSRWTVTVEASRMSADGKKQLEGLDVRVIDTERGRDALADTLSGGEKVIINEAVSLALSLMACRRAGLEGVTLVRDESGAALDSDKARAYVAMLRRAAEMVGASRVLIVTHAGEVASLCDARLVVAGGDVTVAA